MPLYSSRRIAIANIQARRRRNNRQLFALIPSIVSATANATIDFYRSMHEPQVQHNSQLRGNSWMHELLNEHPDRIRNNLGVTQASFTHILQLLKRKTGFCNSRNIGADEQLGVFLFAVATNMSMRRIAERFQHSTATIHCIYHRVMRHLIHPAIYDSVVQPATATTQLSDRIASNRNFYPYFKDCVGAVDGTHIPVSPTLADKALWRNRKGYYSQNVLAICDFDMAFTNVQFGWEGSVSDSSLWTHANRSGIINIPEGKYVLGDAGFANCSTCLVPYRNVRYHLQEWSRGSRSPQDAKELFNLRHSQLRNVVERIFGVMKARYKILTHPRPFQMEAQTRVVAALCVLHNILNVFDEDSQPSANNAANAEVVTVADDEERGYNISQAERHASAVKRDAIADQMWRDYVARREGIALL